MENEKIIEINKVIAEFMSHTNNYWYQNNELVYHSDWNSLMPVVEKIETLDDEMMSVFIVTKEADIAFYSKYRSDGSEYDAPNFQTKGKTKIEATYNAVFKFIQWYNTQKKGEL